MVITTSSSPIKLPKKPSFNFIYNLLEEQYNLFNQELSTNSHPDPIMVAKELLNHKKRDKLILFCALFSYGNAKAIVNFLNSCNLKAQAPSFLKPYRFQNTEDINNFFNTLLKVPIYEIFLESYKQENSVLYGIEALQNALLKTLKTPLSEGLKFLIGIPNSHSPLKRWNMFLRWMARSDRLDFGLWREVDKSTLILPLDTHTFKISHKLGLLKRKSYDLKAALEITQNLKRLDPQDPIKYDFALYRIGQLGLLDG
ncbi:TIGR02757 family protein [Helicobacter burdigaliensis]|uniref:TIGR02757 family protein n=1 Tax=Helicobacter burdigaliensis TaxID=2315334 RepID=UPI001E3FD297|nr:TIGR02757 family protein [Helicobacter burdigaliensis]